MNRVYAVLFYIFNGKFMRQALYFFHFQFLSLFQSQDGSAVVIKLCAFQLQPCWHHKGSSPEFITWLLSQLECKTNQCL